MVTKKLCSTLVTFFLRPTVTWTRCVRHIICALSTGHEVHEESLDDFGPTIGIIQTLRPAQLKAALWFTSMLVEEVGKTEVDSQQQLVELKRKPWTAIGRLMEHSRQYYERVDANAEDAIALMRYALTYTAQDDAVICEHGIACFSVNPTHPSRCSY